MPTDLAETMAVFTRTCFSCELDSISRVIKDVAVFFNLEFDNQVPPGFKDSNELQVND